MISYNRLFHITLPSCVNALFSKSPLHSIEMHITDVPDILAVDETILGKIQRECVRQS